MSSDILTTTCPLDCPDTCALEVTASDGVIEEIRGVRDHPVTSGFICNKVSRFARRVFHERRLLHPMRRVGSKGAGEFELCSWEDAIDEITARFRDIAARWGPEAVLPYHYGGSNGLLTDGLHDDLYFARLGASRLARTLCAAPTTAVAHGMYGKMPGVAFQDYVHSKCIIVWGANPSASNIHLTPFLREARRLGAFVAVVDPVRNFSPDEVDLFLGVRPGTDLPLALGVINLLQNAGRIDYGFLRQQTNTYQPLLDEAVRWPVERAATEAGVLEHDVRRLAEVYAKSSPAVIRCGWGLERNRNGGQAVAAVLALPALLGKFGVRGGGYTLSNSGAVTFDRGRLFDVSDWGSRIVSMAQLGEVLGDGLDPPVKGLFVYNCNPGVTAPDQNAVLRGLIRDDLFTVVFDQVMTDTAAYADVLLPATTFLEHHDIRVSYGSYAVGGVCPVIAPRGDALSNVETFCALARAMGFGDAAFSWDSRTSMREVAGALTLNGVPADVEVLAAGKWQSCEFKGETPVQFSNVFPLTGDGKADLCPGTLGEAPYSYEEASNKDFPLSLLSPATSKTISSTMGEYNLPRLTLLISPEDADLRGISESDRVRVFNELGTVLCDACVEAKVRPGVVSMPKGAWRGSSHNGLTSTALCPAHVNAVGGGACYNDARVEVEKA